MRIGVPPAGTVGGTSLPGAAELGAAALGADEGFGMGFALGGFADEDDAPVASSISTSMTSDELFLALASAELDMSTLMTVSPLRSFLRLSGAAFALGAAPRSTAVFLFKAGSSSATGRWMPSLSFLYGHGSAGGGGGGRSSSSSPSSSRR